MRITFFILFFLAVFFEHNFGQIINRQGKDFALFFAVKDYDDPDWRDLKNPIRDAEAIAKELTEIYGFTIEMLSNPSKEEIYAKIYEYQDIYYEPDAQLFIYISGHGIYSERTKKGYFIPREGKAIDITHGTHIDHSDIANIVDGIPCKHILLTIDACSSGAFANNSKSGPERGKLPGINFTGQWVSDRLKLMSRQFITSGNKKRQKTPDGVNHSPLTNALLEGLREGKYKDVISAIDFQSYFKQMPKPIPNFGNFGTHEATGDFLFIPKGKKIKVDNRASTSSFTSKGSDSISSNTGIPVSKGEFMMGNDEGRYNHKPAHKVSLGSFSISSSEVTLQEYANFLNAKNIAKDAAIRLIKLNSVAISFNKEQGIYQIKKGYEKQPITYLSYEGAKQYCKWRAGRLPTEAEWEYAARGGNQSKNYTFSGANIADEVAVYNAPRISPIKSKKPNELGLYDMSGNVAEWCADYYQDDFYTESQVDNPNGPTKAKSTRVIRGGSWNSGTPDLHPWSRKSAAPDERSAEIGCRCAWDIDN